MPPLPNPHTKPILPKNQSRFSQEELVRRNAGVAELARKMQQTRQMQKYEIQDIKNKASVSSGESLVLCCSVGVGVVISYGLHLRDFIVVSNGCLKSLES